VAFGLAVGVFVITNAEEVRDTIIPTPTPPATRSATEYAMLASLSNNDAEYEQAIEYYEAAIDLDATKPKFYIDLINLLVRTGQPERALTAAEQVAILAPDSDEVWTAVAAAYIANGERLGNIGDVSGASLQYAQAVEAANKAMEINQGNAIAYAYAAGGLVLQEDPERYEQALDMADRAVQIDPDSAIARYYLATVFTYQGFYDAAREQYQLGIQADPNNPDLYIGLAYNYFGTSNIPNAILSFEDAIAVDPNNADAYDGLAFMYIQLGEDALAAEKAAEAVRLDPNMARAHGRLGEAYFRQSNYPKAVEELKMAVQLYGEPTTLNARFFNLLATAYVRTGPQLCPEAEPLFQSVLTVAVPDSPVQISALEGLEECRLAAIESR
jgi:superkiller protein 3